MLSSTACPDYSGKSRLSAAKAGFAGKYFSLLFSILVFTAIQTYSQDTILVPTDFLTIQAGIDAAQNGDMVLVDDGTYLENINYLGKAITVASNFIIDGDTNHISNTIIDGSEPSNPDSASVVTFNSGEDTTSVLCGFTITGGSGTLIPGQTARQGGGVLCYESGTRIEYNIIENNEIVCQQVARGGGISVSNMSPDPHYTYVIIENNKIRNNRCESSELNVSSAGVHLRGEGRIVNNHILNNEAECNGVPGNNRNSFGAGIICGWGGGGFALVKIYDNFIANNRALSNNGAAIGGGVDIQYTICDFRGNTVKDNRVSGAPVAFGGGMRVLYSSLSSSFITDNNFINNGPLDVSVMVLGGGLLTVQTKNLTVEKNSFQFNSGIIGGGMYLSADSAISVRNNKFLQNNATDYGGGIAIEDCSPLIENNLVAGNTSWWGGGVAISSTGKKSNDNSGINLQMMMSGGLGEITSENNVTNTLPSPLKKNTNLITEPLLINNTIVDDSATAQGGGIYTEYSQPTILNTILWGNTAAQDSQIYVLNDTILVEYSNVQGGWTGEGNIDEYPLFVVGDTLFHLLNSSLCIDSGIDSIQIAGNWYYAPLNDIDEETRPYGNGFDMGSDEWHPEPGVELENAIVPVSFELLQNYPNPFNPSTTIEFALPTPGFVSLSIFNILGEKVATPVSEYLAAGSYKYYWNAKGLTSGVYLYNLEAGNIILVRKMILIR
ncbi:MAG: T9SS type A sorting domain-containing protein [Ignavibacteriaceae bacterium]|nr:T9SS type A sorting domain-containing protein [Ignavibacteriaceae bacterium]